MKEKKGAGIKRSLFECEVPIDKSNFCQVFSASLGRVLANQLACSDLVVKGRGWRVDFSEGTISFGEDSYPIQFIGSESTTSNTWLWGWANKSPLPEDVLVETKRLKQLGESYGLQELTVPQLELADINGHKLMIVCSALNENNVCYYRGPHQNGAIFVEFYGVPDEVFQPVPAETFIDITLRAITQFEVEHRIFVTSFLYQNGTPYHWTGDTLTAHFGEGESINIFFEKENEFWRIKEMNTQETP